MASTQTIKIKRSTGSSAPSTLASGELAYTKGTDTFYIGDPGAANTPIAVGGAIKNNAGSPVLATGITKAEIQSLLDLEPGTDVLAHDANLAAFVSAFTLPTSDGSNTQVLQTNGSGTLSFGSVSSSDEDVNVANLRTRLGQISDNTTIGDATDVTITMAGGLTVTGNLTVNGVTTTVNSTTTTVDDPVFTLGGDSAPSSDDNKDRGIEFRYHTGSGAKVGFFGFDDSTGKFTFIPDATNSSEVFSGTTGVLDAKAAGLDAASVTEATAAVSTDYLFFFDGGASGSSAKESIVDFINNVAGTNVTASNGQLTVATATSSTLGVASFDSTQFDVSTGAVTLNTVDGGTY